LSKEREDRCKGEEDAGVSVGEQRSLKNGGRKSRSIRTVVEFSGEYFGNLRGMQAHREEEGVNFSPTLLTFGFMH
jgi:hypothetical protein